MSPERVALYTAWYPGVEPFLHDWTASVEAQTDTDFDVWISLDGLDPDRVATKVPVPHGASWIVSPPGKTPTQVRLQGIAMLAERYDALVFCDSDDWLLPDRIASSRAALEGHDVTACGLRVVDGLGRDLGLVFGPGAPVEWATFLPRFNVFGLSNTAYRAQALRGLPPPPPDCVALDWYLATRAWCGGFSLHFDETPRMVYRQYPANTARILQPFTAEDIVRATEVVRAHHHALQELPGPGSIGQGLAQAREQVLLFSDRVVARRDRLDRYAARLNRLQPRYVWWWCVAHPALEDLWTN